MIAAIQNPLVYLKLLSIKIAQFMCHELDFAPNSDKNKKRLDVAFCVPWYNNILVFLELNKIKQILYFLW
jgi:hypothetical protein